MRKNLKLIIGIIIGIIISTITIVSANTLIKSSEVTYDNSKSNGSFSDVQGSLDELYNRAGYTEEEYHENILNGAYPILTDELIPVVIKGNGDVYYANTHTEWYSYKEKRWANAVILVDDAYSKNRQDKKDKYSPGDKISEEDIESYFVWVPRYAYKIWNLDSQEGIESASILTNSGYSTSPSNLIKARLIDIEFGTKTYLDSKQSKSLIRNKETGQFSEPTDLVVNNYLQHPAFTLGDTELNGFWIGKFETGYNQTGDGSKAITDTSNWKSDNARVNSIASNKIVIKPDIFSWRNIKVSYIFDTCKNYNTNLKSHMLKNTEWGAVAYLSHSKYGKGAEININNTTDMKTGYSATPDTDQTTYPGDRDLSTTNVNQLYNTSTGYLASTTGNITGVYDMAGGAWEYVSATMISGRTGNASGLSDETITAEMKAGYIDVYSSECGKEKFNKRILGDATGEMAPFYKVFEKSGNLFPHSSWYGDYAVFIQDIGPWFSRGGGYPDGINGGLFFFDSMSGGTDVIRSFRVALAP